MRSSENWYFILSEGPNTLSKILLLLQHGNLLPAATLKEADLLMRRAKEEERFAAPIVIALDVVTSISPPKTACGRS